VVRRYAAGVREAGLDIPLLIGIAPLRSARSALWMRKHLYGTIIPDGTIARLEAASDPAAEGKRLCIELLRELAQIPGVAGAHIMAPGNDAAVPEVIRAVRKA
jgi:methylenetetrahydrofolate reductase (NADPH)